MCRWLAYLGSPIDIDKLLFKPEHSLVDQSKRAQRTIYQTNGDGFGLGWYGGENYPGVYRHTRPAWNDKNLRSLSEQIQSGLFLAHVRATSGTAIQRTNCHPFLYQNWLFQHNGEINDFPKIKRDLDMAIDPELYPLVEGSTDTERLFHLALSYGLQEDPLTALRRMVGKVEQLRENNGVQTPFRMTAATSDGHLLYALRYSSHHRSPTLYHNRSQVHALRDIGGVTDELPEDAMVILSEPLDEVGDHWEEVPESTFLIAERGRISSQPFEPLTPSP